MALLQKERLKQLNQHNEQNEEHHYDYDENDNHNYHDDGDDDDDENESRQEQDYNKGDHHQQAASRLAKPSRTTSMRKLKTSRSAIVTLVKKETTSTALKTINTQENEINHAHQSQVIQVKEIEATPSFKKQHPTLAGKISNGNAQLNSHIDLSTTSKESYADSSQVLLNPLTRSSSNLMAKSEIFDQEFYLNEKNDRGRRNNVKDHNNVKIDEKDK